MPMRDKLIRSLRLAVSCLVLSAFTPPLQAGYFPPSFEEPSLKCGNKVFPVLSKFETDWYSRQLAAAKEVSLYEASHSEREGTGRTVRFTWLRSFHHPIIVRAEWEAKGGVRLIAKELSGAGGYPPGQVKKKLNRHLSEREIRGLQMALFQPPLFSRAPQICDTTFNVDGAQWIIESAFGQEYHFVDRWSPKDGEVRRVGLLMLELTGWNVGPIY